MKKIYILFCLAAFSLMSCEEVITVGLDTAPEKLVIDASIQWEKGTAGNVQTIKLSKTAPYNSQLIPTVQGAVVTVRSQSGQTFDFVNQPNTGNYICTTFVPQIDEVYTLTVVVDGQTYTATETLKRVPVIDKIEQNLAGGFTGEDIEIKAFYTDPAPSVDFYLFRYKASYAAIPFFEVTDDRFNQGNQIFDYFTDENLEVGQTIDISFMGISERYYNYMNILLSVAGSNGGSPFQSPPATVRGNIVNTTNPDNYPLGFFNCSERTTTTYTITEN
ncbi:DUF4249 domain-containing protein [Flavobacterium sp.]|uniref:DUF4249 domain-containing protein n=1 Tax=Flavobacterium sp. TaxID=239 RepID=UPI003B9AEEF5